MKKNFLLVKCRLICCSTTLLLSITAQGNQLPSPSPIVLSKIKPMLNSDRIEYFFGSYGTEPLETHSNMQKKVRVTNLYSTHKNQKVMRTLAVVDFVNPIPPPLALAHQKIQNGESIGIALRNDNWTISKESIYFGEVSLKPNTLQLMAENNITTAAIYTYKLRVKSNTHPNAIDYCKITEIYSPQYLTSAWLKALYKNDYSQHNILTPEIAKLTSKITAYIRTP